MSGRRVLDWPRADSPETFDILTNKVINHRKMPDLKALVVDDDELIRSNVAEVLSNEGWDVTEAESAERALDLLRGHMIFFGPEALGGGHLPGSFYYFLLALPMALGFGWVATWHLLVLLLALGIGIGSVAFGRPARRASRAACASAR